MADKFSYDKTTFTDTASSGTAITAKYLNKVENQIKTLTEVANKLPALLKVQKAYVNVSYNSNISISASNVKGYTFLMWIGCTTSGSVGTCYIEDLTSQTTTVWGVHDKYSAGSTEVVGYALYVADI